MVHLFTLALHRYRFWLQVVALAVVALVAGPLLNSASVTNQVALVASHNLVAENPQSVTCEAFIGTAASSPRLATWQAIYHLQQGDDATAIVLLRDLLQRSPQSMMLYPLLSQAYERSQRVEAIFELTDLWVSLGTRGMEWQRRAAVEQLRRVGEKMLHADRRHEALVALYAAWKLRPGDRGVVYYLGSAAHGVDDPLATLYPAWQAIHAGYESDLNYYPDAAHYRLNQLIDADKVEKDLAQAQKDVEVTPNDANCHLQLGWILFLGGRPLEQAIRETQRAIELAPNVPDGYTQMGDLLRYAGREVEAVPWYERALETAPSPPITAVVGLGRAWYFAREYQKAIPWLAQAARLAPDRFELWDLLAASYRYTGECNLAIAAARQTMSLNVNPKYQLYLGQLYESCGLIPEAIKTYQGILVKYPEDDRYCRLVRNALVRLEGQH